MMATLVIGLVVAILFSALFSAAELAIFLPSEGRIRALAEENQRGAAALVSLRTRPERTMVLLRFFDALSDVSAGALVAYMTYAQGGLTGVALAVGASAFLVLYFGELLPMGFAANHGVPGA